MGCSKSPLTFQTSHPERVQLRTGRTYNAHLDIGRAWNVENNHTDSTKSKASLQCKPGLKAVVLCVKLQGFIHHSSSLLWAAQKILIIYKCGHRAERMFCCSEKLIEQAILDDGITSQQQANADNARTTKLQLNCDCCHP